MTHYQEGADSQGGADADDAGGYAAASASYGVITPAGAAAGAAAWGAQMAAQAQAAAAAQTAAATPTQTP